MTKIKRNFGKYADGSLSSCAYILRARSNRISDTDIEEWQLKKRSGKMVKNLYSLTNRKIKPFK